MIFFYTYIRLIITFNSLKPVNICIPKILIQTKSSFFEKKEPKKPITPVKIRYSLVVSVAASINPFATLF
jgi:hypothetical protein